MLVLQVEQLFRQEAHMVVIDESAVPNTSLFGDSHRAFTSSFRIGSRKALGAVSVASLFDKLVKLPLKPFPVSLVEQEVCHFQSPLLA